MQELAYGTLRHHGRLDALTRALSQKPIVDRAIALLVEVALYQIAHTRMPAFAVVDQAVDAVAAMGKPAARSLVNALLRRYLRERAALDARMAASDDPRARFSYPRWWADRVRADHPAHWAAILEAGNARPQLTLRVNARVTTRAALLARLAEAAIDATRARRGGDRHRHAGAGDDIAGLRGGRVQRAGSRRAARGAAARLR